MNKKEVIFCVGVPASGKSTWSKNFVKENSNAVRVCRDDYRYMFKDVGWFEDSIRNRLEVLITDFVRYNIINLLYFNFTVIVDETNLDRKKLISTIDFLKNEFDDVNFKFKIFDDVTYEELVIRDINRDKSVGEEVIKRMYDKYMYMKKSFPFTEYGEIID